jgi:hypothetical protein
MMDYSKLSDFEINKRLAELLGLIIAKEQYEQDDVLVLINGCEIEYSSSVNYCNSWEDMGPIIEREKISISYRSRGKKDLPPQAKRFGSDDHNIADKNPLRAAAIVYLMIRDNVKTEAQASAKGIDL